jgi:hypothetical protein
MISELLDVGHRIIGFVGNGYLAILADNQMRFHTQFTQFFEEFNPVNRPGGAANTDNNAFRYHRATGSNLVIGCYDTFRKGRSADSGRSTHH